MYIDESLAKGLKTRMWSDIDEIERGIPARLERLLHSTKIKPFHRSSIDKYASIHKKVWGDLILISMKFGTRNAPIFSFFLLATCDQSKRESWEEKMFQIHRVDVDWGGEVYVRVPTARISEHAIARLFQRYPDIYSGETENYGLAKALDEIKYVAYMADMWGMFFHYLGRGGELSTQTLSIPFVAKHGLFLGDTSDQSYHCDIRTYVCDQQLTQSQLACVSRIRGLIQNDDFSKIAFLNLTIERSKVKQGLTLEMKFFSQLIDLHSELTEIITWYIKDVEVRQLWKERIHKVITDFIYLRDNGLPCQIA